MALEAQEPVQPGSTYPPEESADTAPISLDGKHFIQIPARLERLISLAIKLQGMADKKIAELDFDSNFHRTKFMNCHKTILFAQGLLSYKEFVNPSRDPKDIGIPQITELTNKYPNNWQYGPEDITEYAKQNPGDVPFAVHAVRWTGKEWKPTHSFLFLGIDDAGNKICFHKAGPKPDMPFELTTLETAIGVYENGYTDSDEDSETALYVVFPLDPKDIAAKK